jgi:cell division protein FtsL
MFDKKVVRRGLYKQIFISILGLTVITAIGFPLVKNFSQRYRLNKEMADLQKEIDSYNKKNENLKKAIDYLKSDQFIEEQARLNMGMKKPGEEVVVIKDGKGGDASNNQDKDIFNVPGLEKAVPQKNVTNITRWWNYFFNHHKEG